MKVCKKYYLCLLGVVCQSLLAQDVASEEPLETVIMQLMVDNSIPGCQICVSEKQSFSTHVFGTLALSDTDQVSQGEQPSKIIPVTEDAFFQIGALLTPFIAREILEQERTLANLERDIRTELLDLPIRTLNNQPIRLSDLLSFRSGMPPSIMAAFTRETDSAVNFYSMLSQQLQIIYPLGTVQSVTTSPQGYAWLLEYLQEKRQISKADIIDKWFVESCDNDCHTRKKIVAQPLLGNNEDYLAPAKRLINNYPSLSLYSNACSSMQALRKILRSSGFATVMLKKNALKREKKHLGAPTYGLYYLQHQSSRTYYIDSRLPGSSAISFYNPKYDVGATILVNTNHPTFIYQIRKLLLLQKRIGQTPQANGDSTLNLDQGKNFTDLAGFYRPQNQMSKKYQFLSFINDILIIEKDSSLSGRIAFDQNTAFELRALPEIAEDLFLIESKTRMDHWKMSVERNNKGDVIALQSDLTRFVRISWIRSIWGIVFASSLLVFSPIFIYLFKVFFGRRKKNPKTNDIQSISNSDTL